MTSYSAFMFEASLENSSFENLNDDTIADTIELSSREQQARAKLTKRGILTREKLLKGGGLAFSERGYHETRVADIAAHAEVSLGNFYRHFTDKDDILGAILAPIYNNLRSATGRASGDKPISSVNDLAHRNYLYMNYYSAHRALFRVAREAAASSSSETFREMWFEMREDFFKRNKGWILSLVRRGLAHEDINVDMLAIALGNMNEQLAYTRIAYAKSDPSDNELQIMARTLADIWWRAIFKEFV